MTDGFVRKKVESLTLGEKLQKLRQQYRMSYTEIAKATRIQAKYLEYLENGEYDRLPAEVYVRGFLRSYARYLGLDDNAFLKLYDKEKHIRENLGQERGTKESVRYPALSTWIITPRTVLVVTVAIVLGGTFLYLFSEFRSFVAEPRLSISNPISGATIDGSVLQLRGQTDPGTVVTVNAEPVYVGSDGGFTEELALQQGENRIVVRATNRFDNMKEETVMVESRREMPEMPTAPPAAPPRGMDFTVRAVQKSVNVTVVSSGAVLYSGTLLPGKEASFTGLGAAVQLTTDDALHTEVLLDAGPPELVGTEAVSVSGKTYVGKQQTISDPISTNP